METAISKAKNTSTPAFTVKGYGAPGGLVGGKTLELMEIERNKPKPNEVLIEVLYCGVCHSDVHQVENDWKNTLYPCVPGHEVVGRVTEVGAEVKKFKVGDQVGVGCMIDSCKSCEQCQNGEEQFCLAPTGPTMTYNGYFKPDGSGFNTFGGYSTHLVVREDFVLSIPDSLDIKSAAPILCAGVTTYSPMKHWNVKAGDKVGVVGIGGLGHMAIMIAKALGAEVTAITTTEEKREAAIALGAHNVLISTDEDMLKQYEGFFNFILVTIPDPFDITPYVCLLKPRASLVTVGLLAPYKKPLNNMDVATGARSIAGSLIGGVAETQEVLDFCAKHKIAPKVEMIEIQDINDAYKTILNQEVQFRFVIDMKSLKD